jgi:hypothetical protein
MLRMPYSRGKPVPAGERQHEPQRRTRSGTFFFVLNAVTSALFLVGWYWYDYFFTPLAAVPNGIIAVIYLIRGRAFSE